MDVSAFEATAARGDDEPELKDVILLIDDDLQVPIKAVIAIVKHVGRLFVFVFALGMCVIIYCFAVSWVCMFWLQTRMLFVASSLLHHCMDEPPTLKPRWTDLDRPVEASKAHTSHTDAQSPPPEPRTTWATQPATGNQAVSFGAKSPEHVRFTSATGIELPEHMRPSSSGSHEQQPSRRDSVALQDDAEGRSGGVLYKLLQRERDIEAEVEAPARPPQHDALERAPTAAEQPAEQLEEPLSQTDADHGIGSEPVHDVLSAAHDHVDGDVNQQQPARPSNAFSFTAEQMAEAARFASEATRGGEKPKSRSRGTTPAHPKLTKDQQKAQTQSNWMSSMTAGKGKENATRPQQTVRPSALTSVKNKPVVPGSTQQKAAQMPLRQTTNGTTPKWSEMASMLGQNESTPAQSPSTSAAASPVPKPKAIPPHLRHQAKPKEEAEEADGRAALQAQSATKVNAVIQAEPAKDVHEEQEEKVNVDQASHGEATELPSKAGSANPSPVIEQSLGATESEVVKKVEDHIVHQQETVSADGVVADSEVASPQTPQPTDTVPEATNKAPNSPYNQCLSFYEQTPELKEPAPRSMSADLIKHMNTTPVPTQTTGHDLQCEGCHRWYVASEDAKLCTPCSAVHDRMQDDGHAMFGDLLTKPPVKLDAEEKDDDHEPEAARACDNCGMHDHDSDECVICQDCDRSDGEACSKHAETNAVKEDEQAVHHTHASDHSVAPVPGVAVDEPVFSAPQPGYAAFTASKEVGTPASSSRREATPADLIELKSSGEPCSSTLPESTAQAGAMPWEANSCPWPSLFDPTSTSRARDVEQVSNPTFRPYHSTSQASSGAHARPAVDPFAAGPFQTDWWANKQAAMGIQLSTGYGTPPPLPGLAHHLVVPTPVVPPGLGGPQAGRQASFDALLTATDVPRPKHRSGYDQTIHNAQLKMRQLAGLRESDATTDLKDFSKTFNVPEAFARKGIDPSSTSPAEVETSIASAERTAELSPAEVTPAAADDSARTSAERVMKEQDAIPEHIDAVTSHVVPAEAPTEIDPEAEKAKEAKKLVKKLRSAKETQEKQNEGATLIPDELTKVDKISEHVQHLEELGYAENGEKKVVSADVGESPGSDDTKSAKQVLREQKKAAREALKVAWAKRDIARTHMLGNWSIERTNKLQATTSEYNQCRTELASLMADGKLHDDDLKVFPVLGDIDTTAPKHWPEGVGAIRRRLKAEQSSASASEDDAKPPAAVPSGPSTEDVQMQEAKAKMASASKLRQQALEYFQHSRKPNVSHEKWKTTGDAKMVRANGNYKKKREALVALFPNTGLPADLEEEFPEIP